MFKSKCFIGVLSFLLAGLFCTAAAEWPQRVLVTNDDGINEPRLWALAEAFSTVSETFVAAAFTDKSGSTNYFSINKYKRALVVQRVRKSKNLSAYAVAGFPADCVVFGLNGLMKDQPPDLVISGINSGSNIGEDAWFSSGTVGAARAAAFLGIPALAVSGLDIDDKEMTAAVSQWVVRFAQTEMVKQLESGEYLTVGFPTIGASEIKGIKIVKRLPPSRPFQLEKVWDNTKAGKVKSDEVWLVHRVKFPPEIQAGSDRDWLAKGYIVIVPMKVGEHDDTLAQKLKKQRDQLPEWKVKK